MTKLPHHVRTGSDEPSHLPVEHESRFRVLRRLHWPQRLRRHSNIKIILVLLLCFALIQLRGSKKVIRHKQKQSSESFEPSNTTVDSVGPGLLRIYTSALGMAEDTFAGFKHRSECRLSSSALYRPLAPVSPSQDRRLCATRANLLDAMSSGGRIGLDSPYSTLGCDMQWFTTTEICTILSRFEKIVLVGDSMLRHVVGAINVLVREDLGYGAVTDWNFDEKEKQECFCNEQFDVKSCSVQGIYKTKDVEKHDPGSLKCPRETINVQIEQINKYPIPSDERSRLSIAASPSSTKPTAFILGHGLWSDLSARLALKWVDAVLEISRSSYGHLHAPEVGHQHPSFDHAMMMPILFIAPNSAGKQKPEEWRSSQGSESLMQFEEEMRVACGDRSRQIDFLGTWNMSIQATKYDGVHMDMRGNLLKAMMVLNWLHMLQV